VTDPSKHIPKLDFFQPPSMLVSLGYDQIFRLGCSHGTFRIQDECLIFFASVSRLWSPGIQGRVTLSSVYFPVNVYAAWSYLKGKQFDEEFCLEGVVELGGISSLKQLEDLPKSLQTLSFSQSFLDVLRMVLLFSHFAIHHLAKLVALFFIGSGMGKSMQTQGFNQTLDQIRLARSLQSLTFGDEFNQSLDEVILPINLKSLTFGNSFDQSLRHCKLPIGLQSLTFGQKFNQELEQLTLSPEFAEVFLLRGFV